MSGEVDVDVHAGVETLPESRWNDLVAESPVGSVFHRTEWLRAVERGTDLSPRHVAAVRDGDPVGLLPNFVTGLDVGPSLPAPLDRVAPRELVSTQPGFGGRGAVADEHAVTARLLDGARAAADRGVWSHRVRALDPGYARAATVLDERGYVPSTLTAQVVLDVSRPLEVVRSGFSKSRGRAITAARKAGTTVTEVEPDRPSIDAFYEHYDALMDRLEGHRFPKRFMHALVDCLGDRVQLLRADRDGEAVGFHLNLRDEERDELHYYFAAVAGDHDHHPSSVLHDHAIERAVEEGYDAYNFGESNADPRDGGFGYKHQYGSRALPVLTWERGLARAGFGAYRVARRLYRMRTAD